MYAAHRFFAAVILGTTFALAACDSPSEAEGGTEPPPPPPLSMALTTDDAADRINVTSVAESSAGLRICLVHNTVNGWWKGVGVNRIEPTVEGDANEGTKCVYTIPGRVSLTFWKAKAFGVHTQVGTRTIDLTNYVGHRIIVTWLQD